MPAQIKRFLAVNPQRPSQKPPGAMLPRCGCSRGAAMPNTRPGEQAAHKQRKKRQCAAKGQFAELWARPASRVVRRLRPDGERTLPASAVYILIKTFLRRRWCSAGHVSVVRMQKLYWVTGFGKSSNSMHSSCRLRRYLTSLFVLSMMILLFLSY